MVRNGKRGAEKKKKRGLTSAGWLEFCKPILAAHADGTRRWRREKCRSARQIVSRRIKLSLAPWHLGIVGDRHDLRQLEGQLYASLLIFDIVALPRGNHGLAAAMFFDHRGL